MSYSTHQVLFDQILKGNPGQPCLLNLTIQLEPLGVNASTG